MYGEIAKGEEAEMTVAELISRKKDAFGDEYLVIRESNGQCARVYRENLEDYLRQKGITELRQGEEFQYSIRNRRNS
ncbi:hypothetical protein [Effusibacillus consociatus]|uniref:Uncharacterized protein n=1 Tax=Effusibacillus consociatus TaxID=1117041 RepID=A0ABV9PY38_9BACL